MRSCTVEECEGTLTPSNTSGYCRRHRYLGYKPVSKEVSRNYSLVKKYQITLEEYDRRLEEQGYECPICKRVYIEGEVSWPVDHDHACCPTQKTCGQCIRGIICTGCNKRLDTLLTNTEWLAAALGYLGMRSIELIGIIDKKPRSNKGTTQIRTRESIALGTRYSAVLEMWYNGQRKIISGGTYSTRVEAEKAAAALEAQYIST